MTKYLFSTILGFLQKPKAYMTFLFRRCWTLPWLREPDILSRRADLLSRELENILTVSYRESHR